MNLKEFLQQQLKLGKSIDEIFRENDVEKLFKDEIFNMGETATKWAFQNIHQQKDVNFSIDFLFAIRQFFSSDQEHEFTDLFQDYFYAAIEKGDFKAVEHTLLKADPQFRNHLIKLNNYTNFQQALTWGYFNKSQKFAVARIMFDAADQASKQEMLAIDNFLFFRQAVEFAEEPEGLKLAETILQNASVEQRTAIISNDFLYQKFCEIYLKAIKGGDLATISLFLEIDPRLNPNFDFSIFSIANGIEINNPQTITRAARTSLDLKMMLSLGRAAEKIIPDIVRKFFDSSAKIDLGSKDSLEKLPSKSQFTIKLSTDFTVKASKAISQIFAESFLELSEQGPQEEPQSPLLTLQSVNYHQLVSAGSRKIMTYFFENSENIAEVRDICRNAFMLFPSKFTSDLAQYTSNLHAENTLPKYRAKLTADDLNSMPPEQQNFFKVNPIGVKIFDKISQKLQEISVEVLSEKFLEINSIIKMEKELRLQQAQEQSEPDPNSSTRPTKATETLSKTAAGRDDK